MKRDHRPSDIPENIDPSAQVVSDAPLAEWSVHPLRERPWSAAGLIAFLVLLHVAVLISFGHWFYLLLTSAILLPSIAPFFFPAVYTLRPDRVTIRTPFRTFSRPWSDFLRCDVGPKGIFLSPFASPSRLEHFRGLYLRFGRHREDVLQAVEALRERFFSC